jgi:DNA mismatch repair ATPase MutL
LFGQGLDIIEVSDDGNGVPIGSRPYMATRHATSKIECIQDIYTGTGLTMGFRGEALFAMSCVSESIVVASRTEDDDLATKLIFDNKNKNSNSSSSESELLPPPNDDEGDNNSNKSAQPEQQPQKYTLLARKVGTTVAVVKPFGNLPARRADITRRIRQERTKIFKLVESYGIFNVGVCFRLMDINQNREELALATSSTSISIQETSSTLLGSAFVRGISSFELSLESYFRNINSNNNNNNNNNTNQQQQQQQQQQKKEPEDDEKNDDVCYNWGIRGLISIEPSLIAAAAAAQKHQRQKRGRITSTAGGGSGGGGSDRVRSVQYYSINGRVVDLPKVTTLLRKLWTTFSNSTTNTKPKKPSAILEFTLPNNSFDINLSPDKRTVLLTNESDLLGIIEEHVTKLWSNESSGIFVDGGTTSLSSTQRQQNNPNKQQHNQQQQQQQQQQQSPSSQQQQQQKQQKQQQQRITAARVSVGGKSTGANTSCRRCARGPSYKHGHDITCPLSQMFNGNGVTEIEVEEDDYQDSDDDDDDDDDDGEVDDNGNRQKHKRRFAFVHDLSKAKMQHDLAGRQKERQQETNELNNNNDDDQIEGRRPLKQTKLSTVVLKLSTMTVAETTTGAKIRLPLNNGDESMDENRPKKKAKVLPKEEEIEGPITSSSTDTHQFEEKEASTTVFSNNNKSDVLENENDIALTINDNDATQQQQDQQLPTMDKISDLERRKWNEIQAKFYSGDDDDGGLQLEQESLQTMISRSISIGVGSSLENTRTKEPVTPDDFTMKSPSVTTTTDLQAGSQQTLSSSSPSYRKETRPENDNNHEGNGKQTIAKSNEQSSRVVSSSSSAASSSVTLSSSYSSSARRRPLLGNLQQFAFQPDNNKKDSDGDVAMGSRGINSLTSKESPPIPSNQTRPNYNNNDEDSSKISSSTTNTSQQSNTRVRQKIRESRTIADNGKDDIESQKGKTKSTSNSSQKQKVDTEIANASDDCSTADDEVVVWESFSSTQDVCYNARLERLNMRKRKHDIDEIRRNLIIKSKDGNTSIVEDSPSRTEESPSRTMNEIDKEVGFDDELDDDNNRNSSNPFIRISKSTFRDGMQVIGQFNLGFVLAKCSRNHLWILDQHACEERYNFEELCKKTVMHEQPLIQPLHLELNPSEEACVLDHMDIFQANGFRFNFDAEARIRHRLSLTALPHSGAHEGRKAVQVCFLLLSS